MNYFDENKTLITELETVNVVGVYHDAVDVISFIRTFPDNLKGNQRADELFTRTIQKYEPDMPQEDIDGLIDDGYYLAPNGDWFSIVHSTKE